VAALNKYLQERIGVDELGLGDGIVENNQDFSCFVSALPDTFHVGLRVGLVALREGPSLVIQDALQ